LIRDNRISYATTEPIVVGYDQPDLPPPAELPTDGSIQQIIWNGKKVDVLANSWVVRASAEQAGPIDFTSGWSADEIGGGFYKLTAPGASVSEVVNWATDSSTVAYAEPNFLVRNQRVASDPRFDELWGLNNTGQAGGLDDADIDAPEAWDITTGSEDVVIAVIDTGVDYTHEDLAANMWVNPGEIAGDGIDNDGNGYIDDVRGWDFAYGDNDPMDVDGHGTHVSGTIGAVANNGVGVTGVSWDVKIMPLKGLGDLGYGSIADLTEAIVYATKMRRDHGINVVASNNSWGGGGGERRRIK
jgi:subtilisin family serine protease